jgi:RimJ/RimL family protein N-acetyltransferase
VLASWTTTYALTGQVFTAMKGFCVERARAACNVAEVRLYVDRDNTRAKATYEKLGFSHCHYDMYTITL